MMMKNIALITDSTISLTPQQAQDLNVITIPLTIVYDNKEYIDGVTIDNDRVKELLAKKEVLQTSQPNLGSMIELFENIKKENYEHIFILSVSATLSGTYSTIRKAIEEADLENVTLIDTKTVAGPIQQALKLVNKLNEEGASVEEIKNSILNLVDDALSFVYPENLDTLKRGGRISKQAATLASLLRIKPLLYLDKDTPSIEKFGTAKTEAKIFQMAINEIAKRNITPETHDMFILECEGLDIAQRFAQACPGYNTSFVELPAILACHAGLKTIAMQWVKKI